MTATTAAELDHVDLDPEERADELLRDLGSSGGGPGDREAERRLHQYGPNELLARCDRIRTGHGDRALGDDDRGSVAAAFERYAAGGLRVLGFAERAASDGADGEDRDMWGTDELRRWWMRR